MQIFDFHTHIFPDDLASHALGKLGYGEFIKPASDGTLTGTKAVMQDAGIGGFLTLHIATKATNQKNVNDFAIAVHNSGLAKAFGSVHPSSVDALDELNRIKNAGLPGIKMHPDYQGFVLDDKNIMYPIFERARDLGLIVLFHAGLDPGFMDKNRASIDAIKNVARDFKGLKFVAAHFGGLFEAHRVQDELAGKVEIYLDTSCSVGFVEPETATKIINRHGAQNILFGSDCPWGDPKKHFEFIDSLKLTDNQKELIFYTNAKKLLNF